MKRFNYSGHIGRTHLERGHMEKKQNVTIKDVAARAGVSLGAAHLVLAGKPGLKDETRTRILRAAQELNYQCNAVASSLKRGETRIGAVLPATTESHLFYYAPIWEGIEAYCESVKDFNVKLVKFPYKAADSGAVSEEVAAQIQEEPHLSGLIVLGNIEPEAKKIFRKLSNQGLPIVLVGGDEKGAGRMCCVKAENYVLGRMMGELLTRLMPGEGSVLACAGEINTPANEQSIRGLEDYIREHTPERTVCKIHYGYLESDFERLYQQLLAHLNGNTQIAGCCSVTARGCIQLGRALKASQKAGKIPAIGSDLFPENIENLKQNVFQSLMFKNPFQQGWQAAESLFQYIFHRHLPQDPVILVKSEVILQSSVSMYEKELI